MRRQAPSVPEILPVGLSNDSPIPFADLAGLRFHDLVDFAAEGYLVTDLHGIILEANQAAAVLLQTRREFLPGKPLPLFVGEGHRSAVYSLLLGLREGGTIRDWHVVLKPWSGQGIETLLCAAGIHDAEGRSAGIRWLLRDVQPRQSVERALRAERDFVEGLLNTVQAIVLVLDEAGRIRRTNPYTCHVTGWNDTQLHARSWEMLLPPEDREPAREMVEQTIQTGGGRRFTGRLLTWDSRRLHVSWATRALPWMVDELGQGRMLLVVGHDLTELLGAQRQVMQAERLAAIGQAMVSLAHESRNLLQRSQACLERLSWRLKDQPEALDLANRSRQAQHNLAHLLDDVRAYAAPIQLNLAACDIREAWRDAWAQAQVRFPDREARLSECSSDVDVWCVADRFRLLQVFRNILENSFDACSGPVAVEIDCSEVELEGRLALRLAFRDNGPGFPSPESRRLFEPFWTTRPHGTGLGLVISRQIVEAHGGRIAVGEKGPPGAEIIITLPRTGP